jgi:hypothetical protein
LVLHFIRHALPCILQGKGLPDRDRDQHDQKQTRIDDQAEPDANALLEAVLDVTRVND